MRDAGKKGRQITAHRQPRAEAGDDAARNGLKDAPAAPGQAQLDVVGPQGGGEAAAEHADDHHSVDAGQRRAVEVNQLIVAPLLGMHARQLQQLTAPAGELAGYRPEGAGEAEVVGRENAGGDNRGNGRPEFYQPGLFEVLPGHNRSASELRRNAVREWTKG